MKSKHVKFDDKPRLLGSLYSVSTSHDSLWVLQGFCERARAVTSLMPGRNPLLSVSKDLVHPSEDVERVTPVAHPLLVLGNPDESSDKDSKNGKDSEEHVVDIQSSAKS